jgi:uncharacterized ferredoxin-like protein
MKIEYQNAEQAAIMQTAVHMLAAARTAPKGKGIDNIVAYILTGEEKDALTVKMREIDVERHGEGPFGRDAGNIDNSEAIVLIGVRSKPVALNCGYCGFISCAAAVGSGASCAFNITDLGIAVGSAASVAADHRIDNRVIYSAGKAAVDLGLVPPGVVAAYGIPLSTTGKSIYFDRKG